MTAARLTLTAINKYPNSKGIIMDTFGSAGQEKRKNDNWSKKMRGVMETVSLSIITTLPKEHFKTSV